MLLSLARRLERGIRRAVRGAPGYLPAGPGGLARLFGEVKGMSPAEARGEMVCLSPAPTGSAGLRIRIIGECAPHSGAATQSGLHPGPRIILKIAPHRGALQKRQNQPACRESAPHRQHSPWRADGLGRRKKAYLPQGRRSLLLPPP